jgi:hypothetical protein
MEGIGSSVDASAQEDPVFELVLQPKFKEGRMVQILFQFAVYFEVFGREVGDAERK